MAGGKGKSSGGKSSGGKTSAADGQKKQQSHSARAGLQVSSICKSPPTSSTAQIHAIRPPTKSRNSRQHLDAPQPDAFLPCISLQLTRPPSMCTTATATTKNNNKHIPFQPHTGYNDIAHIVYKLFMPARVKSDHFRANTRWIRPVIRYAPDRVDGMKLA